MAYTKDAFLPRLSVNTNNHVSSLDISGNVSIGTFGGISAAPTNGMLVSGNVGIGTTTIGGVLSVSLSQVIDSSPTPAQQISINPTYTVTGAASTSIDCVRSIPNFDCTNGNLTGTYSGIVGMPLARGTNTITSMIAVNGNVRMGGSTPVTVTNGSAFVASSWNLVANSTVTNYRGFQTGNVTWTDATNLITNYYHFFGTNVTGAGVITNQYGLFLQNMTKGTTLNYAIYSEGGQSYHVGNLGLNTAIPLNKLDVNGAVAVGTFAGVNTAPSSGMIVSGDVAFGVSSVFGSSRLTVSKTRAFSPSTGEGLVTFMDTTALAADNGASLLLRGIYTGTGTSALYGAIKAGKTNAIDGNLDAYVTISSRNNTNGVREGMRLDNNQRLGVGSTGSALAPQSVIDAIMNNSDTGTTCGITCTQSGAGDSVIQFSVPGVSRWIVGLDNSEADDKFKIAGPGTTGLGNNDRFTIDSSGNVSIVAGNFDTTRSASGSTVSSTTSNTSNTASSNALVETIVAGSSANDPFFRSTISGGPSFCWGIDNSTTNNDFVISASTALGTSNVLSVDGISNNITISQNLIVAGNASVSTAGNGFRVAEGANAKMGTATLDGGTPATVVVNTTAVTANSRIFITGQTLGTIAVGAGYSVSARTAGSSFTITSSAATDTSSVAWIIFEPS